MTIRVVFATDTRRVELPTGGHGVIEKGTHWPADDPIVVSHPDVFSDDPRWGMRYSREPEGYNDPVVEQTTAAPGERRATRRPPPDETSDEAEELRAELIRLGRPVDARWGLRRLREEMEKVAQ